MLGRTHKVSAKVEEGGPPFSFAMFEMPMAVDGSAFLHKVMLTPQVYENQLTW